MTLNNLPNTDELIPKMKTDCSYCVDGITVYERQNADVNYLTKCLTTEIIGKSTRPSVLPLKEAYKAHKTISVKWEDKEVELTELLDYKQQQFDEYKREQEAAQRRYEEYKKRRAAAKAAEDAKWLKVVADTTMPHWLHISEDRIYSVFAGSKNYLFIREAGDGSKWVKMKALDNNYYYYNIEALRENRIIKRLAE